MTQHLKTTIQKITQYIKTKLQITQHLKTTI